MVEALQGCSPAAGGVSTLRRPGTKRSMWLMFETTCSGFKISSGSTQLQDDCYHVQPEFSLRSLPAHAVPFHILTRLLRPRTMKGQLRQCNGPKLTNIRRGIAQSPR